ncbi:MAG TPA: DUF1345 domain-containing protein [Burkholderiales bacterium]|jgi:Predicted membrane protein|nr:DUF1345 domain-containing protein [Burkholderiales bacterium]
MKTKTTLIERLSPIQRLGCALAVALLAVIVEPTGWNGGLKFLMPWDAGTATYLFLVWTLIVRSGSSETRLHARAQDVAAYVIFIVVLFAAFASIAAIALLIGEAKELVGWEKAAYVALSAVALLTSWFLIHTLFSFHYARGFYSSPEDPASEARGLSFPGRGNPDYFDFAYYSFVVGMTSQVSDVSVTTHHMRRLTLIHGILSFIFNIAILALAVNIIVSVI